MTTPQQPPLRRPLLVGLITLCATGGLCAWLTVAAPNPAQMMVLWCGAATALVLSALAFVPAKQAGNAQQLRAQIAEAHAAAQLHITEAETTARQHITQAETAARQHITDVETAARQHITEVEAQAQHHVGELEADLVQLADETLPAVLKRIREGSPVHDVLGEIPQSTGSTTRRVAELVAEHAAKDRRAQFALSDLCTVTAAKTRGIITTQAALLRDMQERYSQDRDLLADLYTLDSLNAQGGLVADRIPVLTNRYAGRPWPKPIVMQRILRGATSRIPDHQRVVLNSASQSAIVGYAAAAVIHALAEILDNATKFSASTEKVHVYVEDLQAGITIAVDDSGMGFGRHQRREAEDAISDQPLDFTTLTEERRLGLLVVGCLARKYGLTVSLRPSSRGGTAVVMLIPQRLVTEPVQASDAALSLVNAAAATSPRTSSTTDTSPTTATATKAEPAAETDSGALPRRRRGSTLRQPTAPAKSPAKSPKADPADLGGFAKSFFGTSRSGTLPSPEEDDDSATAQRDDIH